jgi:ABC-type phosphate transport system substrate-binding protein
MPVFSASDHAAGRAFNASAAPVQAGDVAIIVNQNNPARDISFDVLRKYFKVERDEWPDGKKVVVAMLRSGQPERNVILRSIYGWDEKYYQTYFRQPQFVESKRQPPRELNTVPTMIRFVNYTPGAIGYVRADQVDTSKVKVLSVDGRSPGEGGYRIK